MDATSPFFSIDKDYSGSIEFRLLKRLFDVDRAGSRGGEIDTNLNESLF